MNIYKKSLLIAAITTLAGVFAHSVSAHERRVFQIDGTPYVFVIGSLNEPAFIDDKSGVDLRISKADPYNPTNFDEASLTPVSGLEKTLQVEVTAGQQKKIFALSPVWKTPGAYTATFYPTIATTYTYRVFGTIAEKQIDVSFECASGETDHNATPDTEKQTVSEGVTQIYKSSAFGCPKEKDAADFPEQTLTRAQLTEKIKILSKTDALLATALGLSAVAFAYTNRKKKEPHP